MASALGAPSNMSPSDTYGQRHPSSHSIICRKSTYIDIHNHRLWWRNKPAVMKKQSCILLLTALSYNSRKFAGRRHMTRANMVCEGDVIHYSLGRLSVQGLFLLNNMWYTHFLRLLAYDWCARGQRSLNPLSDYTISEISYVLHHGGY